MQEPDDGLVAVAEHPLGVDASLALELPLERGGVGADHREVALDQRVGDHDPAHRLLERPLLRRPLGDQRVEELPPARLVGAHVAPLLDVELRAGAVALRGDVLERVTLVHGVRVRRALGLRDALGVLPALLVERLVVERGHRVDLGRQSAVLRRRLLARGRQLRPRRRLPSSTLTRRATARLPTVRCSPRMVAGSPSGCAVRGTGAGTTGRSRSRSTWV